MRSLIVFLVMLLLSACGGDGTAPATPPPPDERPPPPAGKLNVLFVIMEDLGALGGAYGTPGLHTPNMDALAASGAVYRRVWVTMGSCTTSKASLFTGRYNQLMGVTDNSTEFVGSYEDLVAANPDWFQDHSSVYYRYAIPDAVPTLIEVLWHAGYYLGLQNKFHQSPHKKFPYDHWYQVSYGDSYKEVSDFIAEAKATQRPWFLVHNIGEPHRPWPDSTKVSSDVDPSVLDLPAHLPDDAVTRRDYEEHMLAIERADLRVGQALQALRDSGEASRTLIVLMGDNGMEYHRGKFSTYNLGLQVAGMFAGPGIAAGGMRSELFSGVDFMPTVLDFLAVAQPGGMNGVSHKALLTGASNAPPRGVLLGNTRSDRSITDGRYTLIFQPVAADTFLPDDLRLQSPWRNAVYDHIVANANNSAFAEAYRLLDLADATLTRFDRPRFELYDFTTDPWQIHDLAADPAYAGVLEHLKADLRNHMQAIGDPGVAP
jgi:N-sulfoglucosamine sulfohydrolase